MARRISAPVVSSAVEAEGSVAPSDLKFDLKNPRFGGENLKDERAVVEYLYENANVSSRDN